MKNMSNITIRQATLSDASRILEIYAPYVLDTAVSFETEVPTLEDFTERMKGIMEGYPYIVAINDEGKIVGYAYAHAFVGRKAYNHSVETTVYLDVNEKRHGLGRALYTRLEELLLKQNVYNVNACIAYAREDNTNLTNDSLHFHEKMGYQMVGTFHNSGYKFDQWYDMFWMEKFLAEHPKTPEEFIPFPELE